MEKTLVVKVERRVRHPLYLRVVRRSKRYKVHDDMGEARVGDRVRIMETRPLSKEKHWRLVEILARAG